MLKIKIKELSILKPIKMRSLSNYSIFLLVFLIMMISCGKQTPLKEPKKLDGLNGLAYYYFSEKDNRPFLISKAEYKDNPFVNVIVKRDTIFKHEEFIAEIVMNKKAYRIFLEDSANYEVKRDYQRWTYKFRPQKIGLYEFKGHIEYDSTSESFHYKFLVQK